MATRSPRESSSLMRSSAIMASGTLVSRILGFVRNALLVAALGATASGAADSFRVALALPTQLYNLLIGGILNAVLVPQIVRALRQRNGEELVNRLLTAAYTVLAVIAGILTIASPLVIMFYASGLGRWQPLAFAFAFWCMPQVFFYGLYALWGQVLNARSHFGPYMWAPVLNNVIAIAALISYLAIYGSYSSGGSPDQWDASRIALLGASTTFGILCQAAVLYIPLVRSGFRPKIVFGIRGMGLRSTSAVALWALLGIVFVGIGDWAITNLGSRAVTAAESPEFVDVVVPSTTMYANALLIYMLPQSLVTTSIITALFTRMSQKAAAEDHDGVAADLSLGLRSVGVFTVLAAVGMSVLAAPALQVFVPSITQAEAVASAPVLQMLAAGVIFQGTWFTHQRVMLAYADTKRLLWAYAPVGAVPVVICLLAYFFAPAPQWMMWAACGSSLANVAGTLASIPLMRRHIPTLSLAEPVRTYVLLALTAVPTAAAGWFITHSAGPVSGQWTGNRSADALVLIIVAASVMSLIYVLVGRIVGLTELSLVLRPAARIVERCGHLLPGGAGRGLRRAAVWLAPAAPRSRATMAQGSSSIAGVERMEGQSTPIGTGRYILRATLPTTLPTIVRHQGYDRILDRPATILTLTDATLNADAILDAASRAALVEDSRLVRVYDVERSPDSFIVMEPATGATMPSLLAHGMSVEQVQALCGELAQALDAASRRGLHHLALSPDHVRLLPSGAVKLSGVGVEAAARGIHAPDRDPLWADRTDARALVDLLYYGLTGRWAGKRPGVPSAPMSGGLPVAPSRLNPQVSEALDSLCVRTYAGEGPLSAAQVASALQPWSTSALAELMGATTQEHAEASSEAAQSRAALGAQALAAMTSRAGAVLRHFTPRGRTDTAGPAASATSSAPTAVPAGVAPPPPPPAAQASPATPAPAQPATPAPAPARPAAAAAPAKPAASSATPSAPAAATRTTAPASAPRLDESELSSAEAAAYAAQQESLDTDDEVSSSLTRTTGAIMITFIVAMLIGVFFAVANLLQLAGLTLSDNDLPAAKTIPTASAPQDGSAAQTEEQPAAAAPAEAAAAPTITSVASLDPFGDENEHPELVSALTDGDSSTLWFSRYYGDPEMGKEGIGLAISLNEGATVSRVELEGTGEGGVVQVRNTSADDPTGGELLAEAPFTAGLTTLDITPTQTSSLVVWVRELPTASDGLNKLTVSQIRVQ